MLSQNFPPNSQVFGAGKLIYFIYTAAHTALLVWGSYHFWQSPSLSLAIVLLVLGGLVYDNLIIFIGDWMQAGQALQALNAVRYWCHGVLSPLLLVFAVQMLHTTHMSWDQPSWSDRLAWGVTLVLITIEVMTRMIKLQLKPVTFAGTLRYKEVVPSHEIPVILVILGVGAIGGLLWQQLHWPWMFWGSLVMLLGSAVPLSTKAGPSIGSGVEVLFGASLLITQFTLS